LGVRQEWLTRARAPELNAPDAVIDDAVSFGDPMALRGLVFQLTGDQDLEDLQTAVRPVGFTEAAVLLNDTEVASVRAIAASTLKSFRDASDAEVRLGPPERLPRSLALTAGTEIPDPDLELWLEELALDPWARALEWTRPVSEQELANFHVIVIGAGMGGLTAAVQLRRAGIPFTVIEKNSGVGGTWFENRYPGARVDSPSRNYMHVFGADFHFSSPFCAWKENQLYLDWVADEFDVRRSVIFDTEVTACEWDDESATWELKAYGPAGKERVWRANVVISAVGFLSRPNIASISGADTFCGVSFHTARWPSDFDLSGRRVAVIGTGCSGYQLFAEVALAADHTSLFQRTPQWVFPTAGYRSPFPAQVQWLDRAAPFYVNFMRFRSSWIIGPHSSARQKTIDPEWTDPHSRNATNKQLRDRCLAFLELKLGGRPELLQAMIPPHPVWSARPVLVDEAHCVFDALLQENVTLVTEGIRRITRTGLETVDGTAHAVDTIVYATGFKANDFLWPMSVSGRGGQTLEDLWAKDGARAYLGCMLPGFPNMFLLYGPNTNPMGGLGISQQEEITTRYALECVERLILDGRRSVDVTVDAYWRYNDALDREEKTKIYSDPSVHTYYQTEFGRSAGNCPFGVNQMWKWLRRPSWDDLVVE
jgi:4-hydroxyacetophenone monooxygenase